jgi:hypothetical protein
MCKEQIKLYKLTYNLTRYPDGEPIDFTKFSREKIKLKEYFMCVVNYNKFDNHNFIEDIDMFGKFAKYMQQEKEDIIITNNEEEQINDKESLNYIDMNNYDYAINYASGLDKILTINNEHSIYIPCNFISSELIEKDLKKVLKINFNINNKSIITYLTKKLNKYNILNGINLKHIYDNNLIKSKFKLEESKIYLPFDETNDTSKNNLEICCKIYDNDIDEFYSINEFNILDTLKTQPSVNCLFDIVIYVSISKISNIKKIEFININLRPRYIFIK